MTLLAARQRPHSREDGLRLRRALAGGVTLAILWSLLWGGWHRTLHGDALAHALAPAHLHGHAAHAPWAGSVGGYSAIDSPSGHEAVADDGTGHEAGSDDCRLLDQLLLADALASAPALAAELPRSVDACESIGTGAATGAEPLAYQARAPPRL